MRRYFEQADFARTDALTDLFHKLNVSLSDPRIRMRSTLWHGVLLRELLLTVGPQTLAVVKLLLLEKRAVFYSQPVARASEAVVALASLLPGALDSIAPALSPIDVSPDDAEYALPLALFGSRDRVSFQPYAPLPVVSDLLRERGTNGGCLIGASHNVGVLLASTAANAARKGAATAAAATASKVRAGAAAADTSLPLLHDSASLPALGLSSGVRGANSVRDKEVGVVVKNGDASGPATQRSDMLPLENSAPPPRAVSARRDEGSASNANRLPVVDALVNMTTGKVSVSSAIEPICRITRQERRLMKDLMVAASAPLPAFATRCSRRDDDEDDAEPTSEDYIRARIREYLLCLLGSIADVPGVLGGPRGGETWSAELASHLDTSSLAEYNPLFVRAWLQTRNAAFWARRCEPRAAFHRPVPLPELHASLMDEALLPVERVTAGLNGLRQNVALASSRAAEGLSSLFSQLEGQMVRLSSPARGASAARPLAEAGPRPATPSKATLPRTISWSQSAPASSAAVGSKPPQSDAGSGRR